MKQPLNEQFKRMQRIAGLNENQINEYSEAIPFDKWESALTDFIQKNLTSDIDEVKNLNDVLRNIIATNEQELASMSEEVKKGINENSESGIYKDIEDDLMNGEFESEQEQIEYLQGIIDFCQEQIASLSKG